MNTSHTLIYLKAFQSIHRYWQLPLNDDVTGRAITIWGAHCTRTAYGLVENRKKIMPHGAKAAAFAFPEKLAKYEQMNKKNS